VVNLDTRTVKSFGAEWSAFTHAEGELSERDHLAAFNSYFDLFPWNDLPPDAAGVDVGCGSGRWAKIVAPQVGRLYAVDPSPQAVAVARANLSTFSNTTVIEGEANALPMADTSLDFAYCLGVLHHVPDTEGALRAIAAKLKPGAPLLLYLYYSLDNRPVWYRILWRLSNAGRLLISKFPPGFQLITAGALASAVYWPLARLAALFDRAGALPRVWPLSFYRDKSFYMMRTDAYDRFCTPLEKRFSRIEIETMLLDAGFGNIKFSSHEPFWVAIARRTG